MNNVAESVNAGVGTAKEDGVPGSTIYNYDNVPYPNYVYPAFPYVGYGGYGPYPGHYNTARYGYPAYHYPGALYHHGAATVVNHKPVHYEPSAPVKSVDSEEH